MSKRPWWMITITAVLATASTAHAQPASPGAGATPPPPGDAPPPEGQPPAGPGAVTDPPVTPPPADGAPPPANPDGPAAPSDLGLNLDGTLVSDEKPRPRAPSPPIELPEIITAPTGRLLQAGVIYSRSGLDTGGGAASDLRVGLGDVAEFGIATTDQIRAKTALSDLSPRRISPYFTATFRMGVAEDRLFTGQPALVLGFRKSFERTVDLRSSRVAELHLVGSKRLGARTTIHVGGVFWDASLRDDATGSVVTLHDRGVARQVRGFGGIELRPLDDALILLDVSWVPQFCYECTSKVSLRPVLSWGVRYELASWVQLQSGVTVPDIASANLLDAQIFGQITFLSTRLHDLVAHRH